ncbi:MAG: hypothetical protein WCK42_07020, partial [Myxococcaceae bacterium]
MNINAFLILAAAVLVGCQGETSPSFVSTGHTSKTLGSCTASKNYHEHQLTKNSTLNATFDDIAVAHLETNSDSLNDSRDSGTAGVDIIPYTVTDGPRKIRFSLSNTTVRSAVLKDEQGKVVFTLNKGDSAVVATLASGKHSLTLTSDHTKPSIIFMMPESCTTGTQTASNSAQASVK